MKYDMINGKYDFKKPENIIAGYVDANGKWTETQKPPIDAKPPPKRR